MKAIIFAALIFIPSFVASATQEIKEVAKGWGTRTVSVSTVNVTLIAGGSTGLAGRYQTRVQNADFFHIAVGTYSTFTYAEGFIVTRASEAATAVITLPLPSGTSIYGLGQGNSSDGTIDVRVIDLK